MRHHRSAIFSGAIALASFFAIGTGAVAGAAPTYGARSKGIAVRIDCGRAGQPFQHVGTVRRCMPRQLP